MVSSESMAIVYIGVGSNTDRTHNVQSGIRALRKSFPFMRCSQIYESASVGFVGRDFYNFVVEAQTHFSIGEAITALKNIELAHGRLPDEQRFAPKRLDLDLLLYNDVVCESPIPIPRPEITYNAFVLKPLAELAGERMHLPTRKTYSELWQQYDKSKQPLSLVDPEGILI